MIVYHEAELPDGTRTRNYSTTDDGKPGALLGYGILDWPTRTMHYYHVPYDRSETIEERDGEKVTLVRTFHFAGEPVYAGSDDLTRPISGIPVEQQFLAPPREDD